MNRYVCMYIYILYMTRYGHAHTHTYVCIYIYTHRHIDRRTDGRTDGRMDGWMDIISYPIKTPTIHWFRLPLFRVKVFSQVRWHPGRNHRAEGWEPNGGTLGSTPVRATIYNHCICTHIYTHTYMYVYIYIMYIYIYTHHISL